MKALQERQWAKSYIWTAVSLWSTYFTAVVDQSLRSLQGSDTRMSGVGQFQNERVDRSLYSGSTEL